MFDNETMTATAAEAIPDEIVVKKTPRIILRAFLQEEGEKCPKACRKCKTQTLCEKLEPTDREGRKISIRIWVCPKGAWSRQASPPKVPAKRPRRSIPVTQTAI